MGNSEELQVINDLVVEFAVLDWRQSRAFYTETLGFTPLFERHEDKFSFLAIGAAQLMIYEANRERNLTATDAPLVRPLGHGVNVQITVPDLPSLLSRLDAAGAPLALPLEERSYRTGPVTRHVRQFAVADPDGYLLRFSKVLGISAAS
ncbi:MAG: VOC family protein [Pseudomonadota bacterium]